MGYAKYQLLKNKADMKLYYILNRRKTFSHEPWIKTTDMMHDYKNSTQSYNENVKFRSYINGKIAL